MEACGCCNGAADGATAPPSPASSSSPIWLHFSGVQVRAGGVRRICWLLVRRGAAEVGGGRRRDDVMLLGFVSGVVVLLLHCGVHSWFVQMQEQAWW